MKDIVPNLFVYGSLRSGFHHPAYQYISKHFSLLGIAKVRGKLFDLGEYPGAIKCAEDLFITGELYELKKAGEFEWAFEQLDDYEGLNPEVGESELFKRELTEVIVGDQYVTGWIYWYIGEVAGLSLIPSGDIFDKIKYINK
jgi:gamma-glutamylcyclotransferase (GGCT)/AIG2-like uncharacterized protein YtfP